MRRSLAVCIVCFGPSIVLAQYNRPGDRAIYQDFGNQRYGMDQYGRVYQLPNQQQQPEIRIPRNCRVGNPDGRCFGAALEDCARYLGFRSLYRVSDEFRGGAHFIWTEQNGTRYVLRDQINNVLTKRGWVRGRDWDETWTKDPRWLEERLAAGFPVVTSYGGDHGVCLCKLTDTQAKYVDNDITYTPRGAYFGSTRYVSRAEFLRNWRVLGWAICLYREPDPRLRQQPRRVPNEEMWRYQR
jgi:hypothetical protein